MVNMLGRMAGADANSLAELRAYEPTFRDHLARILLNVGLPERTVEGLMGSRGIGPTQRNAGVGLVDFTPAGIPLAVNEAQRSADAGDWVGATVNAMAMVPGAKAGTKLLKEGIEGVLDEGAKAASHVDMPLFHGSPTYSGGMYDVGHQPRTDSGYLGGGMYLTPQEWIAKEYAKPLKGSQTPGHITQHRVKEGRFKDFVYDDKYVETLERFAKTLGVDVPFNTPRWAKEFGDAMRAAGYDGARGLNTDGTIAEMVLYDPNKMLAIEKPPGIRAYHGSPHDFDKFDLSKIGTGEGAQAYGHGLYFAENPEVARQYRHVGSQPFADSSRYVLAKQGLDHAQSRGLKGDEARTAAIAYLNDAAKALPANQRQAFYDAANNYDDLISKPPGKAYEVSINAHPDEFLDWDKPLSEQPKAVQDLLRPIVERAKAEDVVSGFDDLAKVTGGDAYGAAASLEPWSGGPRTDTATVSEKLRAAGIKGIRYKDAGSRNAGGWHITPPTQTTSGKWMVKSSDYNSKGLHFDTEAEAQAALAEKTAGQTHNYVVFDDKIIDILRKYGIAGLTAGGFGALAAAGMPTEARAGE